MANHVLKFLPAACALAAACAAPERAPSTAGAQKFLSANPAVRSALRVDDPQDEARLLDLLARLDSDGRFPPISWPPGQVLALDSDGMLHPPAAEVREIHLRRAAWALYVELHAKLPWSLASYSPDELDALFSAIPSSAPGHFWHWMSELGTGLQSPWLRPTRRETIFAMAEWVHENLAHIPGDQPEPVDFRSFLKGGRVSHCHNNGDFLAVSAATLNIPWRTLLRGGHRFNDFPSEGLALLHNDDLFHRRAPGTPIEEYFIAGEERLRYLDAAALDPAAAEAMSKLIHVRKALQRPDAAMLAAACAGRDAVVKRLFDMQMAGNESLLAPHARQVGAMVDEHFASLRIMSGDCP